MSEYSECLCDEYEDWMWGAFNFSRDCGFSDWEKGLWHTNVVILDCLQHVLQLMVFELTLLCKCDCRSPTWCDCDALCCNKYLWYCQGQQLVCCNPFCWLQRTAERSFAVRGLRWNTENINSALPWINLGIHWISKPISRAYPCWLSDSSHTVISPCQSSSVDLFMLIIKNQAETASNFWSKTARNWGSWAVSCFNCEAKDQHIKLCE